MRKINEIIIHCSATPAGRDVHASDIDRWHRERGFRSIGYHYVVCLDGSVETGRPESLAGAHCSGHNRNSIGVCYIGGCNGKMQSADTRTNAQRDSMRRLVKELRERYRGATVHCHREFGRTACPGFNVGNL